MTCITAYAKLATRKRQTNVQSIVDRVIALHLIRVPAILKEGASKMKEHSQHVSLERNLSIFMAKYHASCHEVKSKGQA